MENFSNLCLIKKNEERKEYLKKILENQIIHNENLNDKAVVKEANQVCSKKRKNNIRSFERIFMNEYFDTLNITRPQNNQDLTNSFFIHSNLLEADFKKIVQGKILSYDNNMTGRKIIYDSKDNPGVWMFITSNFFKSSFNRLELFLSFLKCKFARKRHFSKNRLSQIDLKCFFYESTY